MSLPFPLSPSLLSLFPFLSHLFSWLYFISLSPFSSRFVSPPLSASPRFLSLSSFLIFPHFSFLSPCFLSCTHFLSIFDSCPLSSTVSFSACFLFLCFCFLSPPLFSSSCFLSCTWFLFSLLSLFVSSPYIISFFHLMTSSPFLPSCCLLSFPFCGSSPLFVFLSSFCFLSLFPFLASSLLHIHSPISLSPASSPLLVSVFIWSVSTLFLLNRRQTSRLFRKHCSCSPPPSRCG